MNLIRMALVLALFFMAADSPSAGDASRKSGFTLLNDSVGGRAAAMGDAASFLPDDQTALSLNPATAALMESKDFVVSHHSSFADVKQSYAGWAYGNGRRGIGLSVGLHTAGDFDVRTGPSAQPIGTFHLFELNASWTYAQAIRRGLFGGFSMHALHQDLASERASGLTIDAGLLYRMGMEGLMLGVSIRHVGRMEALDHERVVLPREIRAGGSLLRGRVILSTEMRIQRFGGNGVHVGGEIRPHAALALRGGYVSGLDARDLTIGFGLRRANWRLDYAYVPSRLDLGDSHRVSVGIR